MRRGARERRGPHRSHPPDAVQLWAADVDGIAVQVGLIREVRTAR